MNCLDADIQGLLQPHSTFMQGVYQGLTITSAFQPIYSLAHRRAVGYEGLMRVQNVQGESISPLAAFAGMQTKEDIVVLDRLSRAIHCANFSEQGIQRAWLFLNVNPYVAVHGRTHGPFFTAILQQFQLDPSQIVVEIVEDQIRDEGLLSDAVSFYKALGCLVAIDDFGTGESNFDRIWRLRPDIVKLDQNFIKHAASNQAINRIVPDIVRLLHETGSLVVMEGIESEQEALIAQDAEVDLVQGYFFARPQARAQVDPLYGLFDTLKQASVRIGKCTRQQYDIWMAPYLQAFNYFRVSFVNGIEAASACLHFLSLPDARRCYVLDDGGCQLGANMLPGTDGHRRDQRFLSMTDGEDACWAHRHYYRRAVAAPGEVQVSRPYLSISDGTLCITLSVAVYLEAKLYVLCGDIAWQGGFEAKQFGVSHVVGAAD